MNAARVGDLTAHGTALGPGPGCETVLIEGRPAWRAHGDVHNCPLRTGPLPHGAGHVVTGSSTVLIGGHPAARQGDALIEAAGPNLIVTGARTVFVG